MKQDTSPKLVMGLCMVMVLLTVQAFATPWTPAVWQDDGKLRNWVRDLNANFVEDVIEGKTGLVDIVVDLNQCIGDPASSVLVAYLNTLGDVVYVGKYLSFIVAEDVPVGDVYAIGLRPEVAMVEFAGGFVFTGDNTKAAQIEDSSDYNDLNLQDIYDWPTGDVSGHDINICFIDSGVGSDYDDVFKYGYNAITDTVGNPPSIPEAHPGEEYDHATWMASWVWSSYNGTAPQAGLIDIKVADGPAPDSGAIERALEKAYEMRDAWNIHIVVLMSGSDRGFWDDRDRMSQLINLLAGNGVVVVSGAGGNSRDAPVSAFASASRAIAVNAADIKGSVHRSNDESYLAKGPRAPDTDADPLDELKPEVCMPTGQGSTLVSNSIASALTSGLAALILDYNADLANRENRAAGSVKDLLIRTAESKGTPHADALTYPHDTPTWNEYWGYGEINAFQAFEHLSGAAQEGRTDLTFIGYDDSSHPHPTDPWFYSHAIDTDDWRLGRNVKAERGTTVYARIYNDGPNPAQNVRVSFGFYAFSGGSHLFFDIGSALLDSIDDDEAKEVSIPWMPQRLHPGEHHGCIMVTIDYGYDTDFSNMSNYAQCNLWMEDAGSPARFTFGIENPLSKTATMNLVVTTKHTDWAVNLSETSFSMAPHDCSRIVEAIVEPGPQVEPGAEAIIFVTAYATAAGAPAVNVGGVALKARYRPIPPARRALPALLFPLF